jgi:hypothetical protein
VSPKPHSKADSSLASSRITAATGSGIHRLADASTPRFALFEKRDTVLIRHFSMREWPPEKFQHFSGNFFTETLAWLVRSGLVKTFVELQETRIRRARNRKKEFQIQ